MFPSFSFFFDSLFFKKKKTRLKYIFIIKYHIIGNIIAKAEDLCIDYYVESQNKMNILVYLKKSLVVADCGRYGTSMSWAETRPCLSFCSFFVGTTVHIRDLRF